MKLNPVAEVRSSVRLGGKDRTLVFNCNTMVAYEQVTEKFFLHTISELIAAVYPNGIGKAAAKNPYEIIERVSMTDLRALVWAAMHDYDENDNPVWPLTIQQIGRILGLSDLVPTFMALLKGQIANSPSKDEMGESPAEGKTMNPTSTPPITQESGGERGIELPADAFA